MTFGSISESKMIPQLAGADEELCLLGVTRLAQYIDFVRHRTSGGEGRDDGEIADEWRAAADVYASLQAAATAPPAMPEIKELPAVIQTHVDLLVKLPQFRRAFASVPIAFGMVELDKLIVYQHELTLSTVNALRASLPTPLTDAALAAACLPLDQTSADFRVGRSGKREFVFHSDSHDMRFLGAQLIEPSKVPELVTDGFTSAVIALAVGFSNNVLNVVRYDNRVVLNNGYHRAYALRSLGVRHAPCVIQVCRHWEDVTLAGSSEMTQNADLYFSTQRPPQLHDFFDGALTRRFATRPQRRQLHLKIDVASTKIEM